PSPPRRTLIPSGPRVGSSCDEPPPAVAARPCPRRRRRHRGRRRRRPGGALALSQGLGVGGGRRGGRAHRPHHEASRLPLDRVKPALRPSSAGGAGAFNESCIVARVNARREISGRGGPMYRIAPLLCTALLVLTTAAWAQGEIRGVVSYVDPATRTIYFTDGRIVQLKSGSTLMINGQPVMFESVRPGASVVMLEPGATATTVTTITQQTQAMPAPAPVAAPVN